MINNTHCPICNKPGVDFYSVDHCPQCESNLLPFRLLDQCDINDENKASVKHDKKEDVIDKEKAKTHKQTTHTAISKKPYKHQQMRHSNLISICFIGMSMFMFCLLIGQLIFFTYVTYRPLTFEHLAIKHDHTMKKIDDVAKQIHQLHNQIVALSETIDNHTVTNVTDKSPMESNNNEDATPSLNHVLNAEKQQPPLSIDQNNQPDDNMDDPSNHVQSSQTNIIHTWQPSDTLWSIARTYWQNGSYYPVLLETNKNLNVYHNPTGIDIKIMNNIDDVDDIFHRIVSTKGNQRYMHYMVQNHDDWPSITKKFYGHYANDYPSQPTEALEPGKRITITLREDQSLVSNSTH